MDRRNGIRFFTTSEPYLKIVLPHGRRLVT